MVRPGCRVSAGPALPLLLLSAILPAGCGEGGPDGRPPPGVIRVLEVAEVGLEGPVAVVHDPVDDVYLVSNLAGGPLERNERGFLSRLSPEGEVLSLRWVDGASPEVRLNAPKGIGLRGDSVFVADIDCVRIFHRTTGQMAGFNCLQGVTYLNGLAVGPQGSIFVTDSGLELADDGSGLVPSGTDAVYRLAMVEGRASSTLARDPGIGRPSGIAVGTRGIFFVTAGTGEIVRVTPQGDRASVMAASDRVFEGIVFLRDGGFAYSSRDEGVVYLVDGEGRIHRLLEELVGPAAIGYDWDRHRLLIPLPSENRMLLVDLEE